MTIGFNVNESAIKEVKRIDRNTIEIMGVDGRTVIRVRRELSDWQVNLVITADGKQWHNSEATRKDRDMFDRLYAQSFEHECAKADAERARVHKACLGILTPIRG